MKYKLECLLFLLIVLLLTSCESIGANADKEIEKSIDSGRAEAVITFQSGATNYIIYADEEEIEIEDDFIPVFINGKIIKFYSGILDEGTVLIPIELLSEKMGIDVVQKDGRLIFNKEQIDIKLVGKEDVLYVDPQILAQYGEWTVQSFIQKQEDENSSVISTRTILYIDRQYDNDKVISRQLALETAKELCIKGLENFEISLKANLESSNEDVDRFNEELTLIKKSIEEMSFIGEVSRYYIFDMYAYHVVFDKFNGEVYFNYSMGLADYTELVDINNPGLYTPLFIIG